MSGVVDVWCGGCRVWWMSGVVDVLFYLWCGGCLMWWMSGVVDVCVVDVVQSWKVSTAPWEPFCQWILWQKRVNIFFAAENLDCCPVTPGQSCQPLCRRSPGSKTDSSAPKFSWWDLCPFPKLMQIQVFYPTCNPCNISSMANLRPKINRTCLLWNPNAHSCVLLFTKIWLNLIWFDLLCCTVQYSAYSFLQRKTRLSIFMNNIYWI